MSARVVCSRLSCRSSILLQPVRNLARKMSGIDTPHLTKGDPQPPVKKGLLRLYSMRFCPFAQRAILVLDAKNVSYDTVNANLTVKPEWLFNKSDGAKVPALEFEDGQVLSESLIIADYLEEAYPQPSLYPSDPLAKAQDRLLIDKFGGVISSFYKIILSEDGFTAELFERLVQALEKFETELAKRGTAFFAGSAPGMLDLMIWPWVERAPLLQVLGGSEFVLPKDRLSKLTAWRSAMLGDATVRKSALPPAVHQMFLLKRKSGIYDFNYDSHL